MRIDREHDLHRVPPVPRLCRYLSERSPQPMVAVDGITHVVSYVNPAFTQLVGKEPQELLGRPFAEAVPEGDQNGCLALLDRVFQSGTAENLAEQEHRNTQPGPVYWSYAMWAILGGDERPVGVMIQITDSTETAIYRRQAVEINQSLLISAARQHELGEAAESLNAKLQAAVHGRDHFLAVLSHELRNPLAAFSSGLQLLKLTEDDPETAAGSRDMMERQLEQLVRLVDDLLDVSRISTGKLELHLERVDLASILRDAVDASRAHIEARGHEVIITLPPQPVVLDADPVRLGQVFLNLLNNASKYSERSQTIRLTARLVDGEVEVSVQDQGIGILSTELPHVFEAFVQVDTSWHRAQGGMGIGLSLVKEFVELHRGRVDARSEGLGQGSEFVVRLPVATGAANKLADPPEKAIGPRRHILVVDDNRDAALAMSMMLRKMGHDVQTAHDGESAVISAREYGPELVLMDLGMPGVDGFEAARRIREQPWGTDLFLVALTGWGAEDDRKRTLACGFNRHLVKPLDLKALAEIIAEIPIDEADRCYRDRL